MGLAAGLLAVALVVLIAVQSVGVLLLMTVSILIAAGVEPAVDWLRPRIHLPRGAIVLVVNLLFFASTLALLVLIVPTAVDQLDDLTTRLPMLLADLRESVAGIEPEVVADALTRLVGTIEASLRGGGGTTPPPEDLVEAGLTAADVVISFITILTLVFFWMTGRARIQRFIRAMLPGERRAAVRETWSRIEGRIGSWVRGQLTLMASIFLMTSVGYFILDPGARGPRTAGGGPDDRRAPRRRRRSGRDRHLASTDVLGAPGR
jgi:predicted PurR-regulated permease PerM